MRRLILLSIVDGGISTGLALTAAMGQAGALRMPSDVAILASVLSGYLAFLFNLKALLTTPPKV